MPELAMTARVDFGARYCVHFPMKLRAPRRDAADKITDGLNDGFPRGLARPALRALSAQGFTRLKELTRITESELLQFHGRGPKAVRTLAIALRAKGLPLKRGPDSAR